MFLEQPDSRDSGRTRADASLRIFQCDAAQRDHWDFFLTSFMEGFEARGTSARLSRDLFKDWPENRKIGAFFCRSGDFGPGVTRDANRGAGNRARQ